MSQQTADSACRLVSGCCDSHTLAVAPYQVVSAAVDDACPYGYLPSVLFDALVAGAALVTDAALSDQLAALGLHAGEHYIVANASTLATTLAYWQQR